MPILKFQGHSDDTFGEYGHFNDDHDNCANGSPIVFKVEVPEANLEPDAQREGLFVWGLYGPVKAPKSTPGCWVIGLQQLDEDVPLPSWPMRWEISERGYSPVLILDAPEGVTLTRAE